MSQNKSISKSTAADPYNYDLGTVNGKHGGAVYIQHDGEHFSFGDANNLPVAFKQLTAKINVETFLNKPENLNLSHDVPLDGSGTIEVIHL